MVCSQSPTDLGRAREHEPGLSSMVCSQSPTDPHVRTRRDDRNIDATGIIPLLPGAQPFEAIFRFAAAISCRSVGVAPSIVAERAAVRAIPQLPGHTFLPNLIVSHPACHIVVARRLRQISMTSDFLSKERKSDGPQHLFEQCL